MKLRSGIVEDVVLYQKAIDDKRIISGRSLIFPQATYSLQAKIAQVLDDTPKSVLEHLRIRLDAEITRAIVILAAIPLHVDGWFHRPLGHAHTRHAHQTK